MDRQPVDLNSLLTVSPRGRGCTARGGPQGSRGWGTIPQAAQFPPSFDAGPEAEDTHRYKRLRNTPPKVTQETSGPDAALIVPFTPDVPQTWVPKLMRGDRPIHVGDSASFLVTAFGLAQGLLLPADMQKELASAPDMLVSTGIVSGIKVTFFSPLYTIRPIIFLFTHRRLTILISSSKR